MENVLVIIDMQPQFASARDQHTVANCQRLIRSFKQAHKRIIAVELESYGDTHEEINALLTGYTNFQRLMKGWDDGSAELLQLLKSPCYHLTICGVNLAACVAKTVKGLLELGFAKIDVVSDACNDTCWGNPGGEAGKLWSWGHFWEIITDFRADIPDPDFCPRNLDVFDTNALTAQLVLDFH